MARTSSKAAEVTTEKLMKDLQTVVEDAEALLKATASQAGEKIQEARAKAQESLTAAKERIRSIEHDALRQAKALVNDGEEYVRDNPWTAVGIAAGAGLLLGLLLSRR